MYDNDDNEFFQIQFTGVAKANQGLGQIPLILVGENGAASFPIVRTGTPANGCPAPRAEEPVKPTIAEVANLRGGDVINICGAGERTLRVKGSGLKDATSARFGSFKGEVIDTADKQVLVTVLLKGLEAADLKTQTLELFDKAEKPIASKTDVKVTCEAVAAKKG